ncbi:MAG: phage terminase small subunit P27 family [Ruminococcus sp.]|nr:phage terminase small subunit P27 family [Ruminococcus sp.]
MGRTRKPLSEQKGHLTSEEQVRRAAEQGLVKSGRSYIARPPGWLSDRAKKEYARLYECMKSMDMLGDLDANNLAAYCEAFDNYLTATEDIRANGLTVVIDGEPFANPAASLQTRYAKEMREFGKQCGLSIDSRLKFASAKLETIEESITGEFGDI